MWLVAAVVGLRLVERSGEGVQGQLQETRPNVDPIRPPILCLSPGVHSHQQLLAQD